MNLRRLAFSLILAGVLLTTASAEKKSDQPVKPIAGPRSTALRVTILYVAPNRSSQKVDRIQIGREMVVAEKSGPWLRVYANTDIEEVHTKDAPIFSTEETPPPVSGWIEAKGIVAETTTNGDQLLMGEAINQEALASNPRGPINAAQSARFLYRRLFEMFPNSPLVPEARWRAADILWQIQKADAATRPSSKERDTYLHDQMDEEELKKVIKLYPHTKQADLATYELIENKLCGDWQGSSKCPEKESEIYEKYAGESPNSVKTAQALYLAVYRQAVLTDMYAADGNSKKGDAAHNHAKELTTRLKDKFPLSDFAYRAASIVYKLDEGVPVYGIDRPAEQ